MEMINIEQERKPKMEEPYYDLNCVKKEESDEEFDCKENVHLKQYTVTSRYDRKEIVSIENTDNLIGFLDEHIIMEKNVKLEVKEEDDININNFCCNDCGKEYKGYCLKCPKLSHILNDINPKSKSNCLPGNILKIKDISTRQGIFTLHPIQKGITFGPFDGISAERATKGFMWRTRDGKLMNVQNGNWMRYVSCSMYTSNLDVFQMDGNLYFTTNRDIEEDEELFVYYEMQILDNSNKCYFIPRKKEESFKIFACTRCCLGFDSKEYLIEHKLKCPYMKHDNTVDIDIMECSCCKVWMEKQEHLKYHIDYCWDNYLKASDHPKISDRGGKNTSSQVKTVDTEKLLQCHQCFYQTNRKDVLRTHLNTHSDVKAYQCAICKRGFNQKSTLFKHKKTIHVKGKSRQFNYPNFEKYIKDRGEDSSDPKRFQCKICKRNYTMKGQARVHILDKHTEGVEKRYQCANCSYKSNHKGHLQTHILDKHMAVSASRYKCSKCPYVTNRKNILTSHLMKHGDVEPLRCKVCEMTFTRGYSLKQHMKNIHENGIITNNFKCTFCPYESVSKSNFLRHQNMHEQNTGKRYKCQVCGQVFARSDRLKLHVKNKHMEGAAKDYRCKLCPYETNRKDLFDMHFKNKHMEGVSKDYKCLRCPFQTNYKENIKKHLYKHDGVCGLEIDDEDCDQM